MRRLFVLTLLLVAASPAGADVPLPPGLKTVQPRINFEGVDKYADQAFILKYRSGNGNPYAAPITYVEVKNAEPFTMKAGRRIVDMELYALPAKDAAKLRAEDPNYKWLNTKTPGVLRASLTAPSTTASVKDRETPLTSYRVTLKDDKLTVEMAPARKKSEAPAPAGDRTRVVAFGLAAGLSLAFFGLWLARKQR